MVLKGRFIHRLIEVDSNGAYTVDRQGGKWGSSLEEVVGVLEKRMSQKYVCCTVLRYICVLLVLRLLLVQYNKCASRQPRAICAAHENCWQGSIG